jgi:hypothetical protein
MGLLDTALRITAAFFAGKQKNAATLRRTGEGYAEIPLVRGRDFC